MLRITTCTKKLILAALLGCTPLSNLHAGIFSELFCWGNKYFFYLLGNNALGNVYPGNMVARSGSAFADYISQLNKPADNQVVEQTYPQACKWVQKQIKKIGSDPKRIFLTNVTIGDGASSSTELYIPLASLETLMEKQSATRSDIQKTNQICTSIAHEIGHIKHHSQLTRALAPLIAIACTEATARLISPRITTAWWSRCLFKTICSQTLVKAFIHLDEYLADSFATSQFKNEPQALIDRAQYFINLQQNECSQDKKIFRRSNIILTSSPLAYTIFHLVIGTHGSHLWRANICLRHAGVRTTQTELMQELDRQVANHDQLSEPKPEFDFDMSPILAASEKNKARAAESENQAEKFRELLILGGYGD